MDAPAWPAHSWPGSGSCSRADETSGRGRRDGIRQISSAKHLTLYTDLPPSDEIDALPAICSTRRSGSGAPISASTQQQHADWHVRGCLMKSRERFQAAGLVPADLPQFHERLRPRRPAVVATTKRAPTIAATCCCTKGRTPS